MDMQVGLLIAFFSMLAFGFSDIFTQRAVRGIGSLNSGVYRGMVTISIAIAALLISGYAFVYNIYMMLFSAALGLFGFVPYMTFLAAMKKGKIGIVSPISNSAFVVTVILAVVVFSEHLTMLNLFSILLVLLGVIFLTINFKDIRYNKEIIPGALYAAATAAMWGIFFLLYKIPVDAIGPYATFLITEVFVFIPSFLILAMKGGFIIPDKPQIKILISDGVFVAFGGMLFSIALLFADVGIVTTITKASPLVAAALAVAINKERLRKYQYPAMIAVVAGVLLLAIL